MSVPNPTYLDQIRRRVAEDVRIRQSDALTLLAELDRLTDERDQAWAEVMDRRTKLQTLHHYVSQLKQAAANHPSEVMRLNDEVDAWATRCGAAEADRDEWREKCEALTDTATRRRNPFAASSARP